MISTTKAKSFPQSIKLSSKRNNHTSGQVWILRSHSTQILDWFAQPNFQWTISRISRIANLSKKFKAATIVWLIYIIRESGDRKIKKARAFRSKKINLKCINTVVLSKLLKSIAKCKLRQFKNEVTFYTLKRRAKLRRLLRIRAEVMSQTRN